jgi:threonine/homoserine/homoserine lactone efflux protein
MLAALLVGFALGFLGSIPLAGPIAAMVLERAAQGHAQEARSIALGSAVAESAYALMAFVGLTTVLVRFPHLLPATHAIGIGIIVIVGFYFLLKKPRHPQTKQDASPKHAKWLLGFTITAVNPTLLVTWTAAITAVHATGWLRTAHVDAFPFAAGVGGGIVTWFLTLLWIVGRMRDRFRPELADRAVRAMGGLFVLGGLVGGVHMLLKAIR